MKTPETVEDLHNMYERTVHYIAKRQHYGVDYLSVEDMEQAIWEHAVKEFRYYKNKTASEIEAIFTKVAKRYWSKQRIEHMYAVGCYIYSPEMIKEYLEDSVWTELQDAADIDARIDLLDAFKSLPPKQSQAVYKHYAENVPLKELSDAEKRNVLRGIDNLTHYLNEEFLKFQQAPEEEF